MGKPLLRLGERVRRKREQWERQESILALSSPQQYDLASSYLSASDKNTRLLAVKAVARCDPDRAIPEISPMSRDSDPLVRQYAVEALAALNDRRTWPYMIAAAKDDDPHVAHAARNGIKRLAGRGDEAELMDLAEDLGPRHGKIYRLLASRIDRRSERNTSG